MKPLAEIYEEAADLVAKPGGWIQGALACTEDGDPLGGASPYAVCWCALGAIEQAMGLGATTTEVLSAADFIATRLGMAKTPAGELLPLAAWNDQINRTQAEVVAALRKAAAMAREAAQ